MEGLYDGSVKKNAFLLACVVVVALGSTAYAQLARDAAITKAEAILKNLQEDKTADVVKEFDATMTRGLPEDKLTTVWPFLVAQFGAFKAIDERREGPLLGMQAVELILAFEKDTLVQRVVFDKDGKVAGLSYQPSVQAMLPAGK
jgi:hypothetical protein